MNTRRDIMSGKKNAIPEGGIYNAKELGIPKMLVLGIQHMFAMFGATVLVPILTGLDVATTLLMAGAGTLFFHLVTKGKVPAFLGSSFAFLAGYAAIAPAAGAYGMTQKELLPYACLGVAAAGLVYLVLAALIKLVGIKKIMKFFPPVVTGPIIIAIGLGLAGSAVSNCKDYGTGNMILAVVALLVVIFFNIWGKGMLKIIPILLGVIIAYVVGIGLDFAGFDVVDFTAIKEADIIGLPVHTENTILGIDWSRTDLIVRSLVAIIPIALATMMEHIGDISAISATCGKNYIKDPGLHRTLIGDGLATSISAVFGGPANTTYGENTGVLALSRVYDPKVIRLAAVFAIVLSIFPKFSAAIETIPTGIIGGISFVLYGMISAIGVRNLVENKVDFSKSRNLIIAAVILVSALGIKMGTADGSVDIALGSFNVSLTPLAIAAVAGIVLNAILPGKDFDFNEEAESK